MILILDDHPVVRQGIESVLHLHKPNEEIIQAGTIKEAMEQMQYRAAEIVFVDINLESENGFTFIEWLQEEGYQTKTFVITSSSREWDYLYAQQRNVDAYLLKEDFIDDILYGLKVVERGGKFYSPATMKSHVSATKEEALLNTLTSREYEVLVLLSQGHRNAKIGEILYISEGTTKRHITSILNKLGVQNRIEAMLLALNSCSIQRTVSEEGLRQKKA